METPKKTMTEIKEYDISYPDVDRNAQPHSIEAEIIENLNYRNAPEYHFHADMKDALLGDQVIDSLLTLNTGKPAVRTHYSIIVTDMVDFSDNIGASVKSFSVPRNKALCDYTSRELREQYATLESAAIKKLLTFPTVFANINQNGISTGYNKYAAIGYIAEIDNNRSDNDVCIVADIRKYIRQQNLNLNLKKFGLAGNELTNELAKIHWDIKGIDLFAVLSELKIPGVE